MPTVGPQGSRGGLITATVVFTILFVTATIFAIYFGVDDNKKTELLATQANRTKDIYSAQDMLNQRFKELSKPMARKPGTTIMQVAFQDAQDLAELVSGKSSALAADPHAAAEQASKALDDARQRLAGLNLPANLNLVSAINALAGYAAEQHYQNLALRVEQSNAAGDAVKQIQLMQAKLDGMTQDIAAANKIKDDYLAKLNEEHVAYLARARELQQSSDQQVQVMNAQLQRAQQAVDSKQKELDVETQLANKLNAKISMTRIPVNDPLLRQTDAQIASVASDDVVYINLGMGDHVVPGMTFEVYSRRDGIPKQDDLMSEDNMPIGLGSIEVERVDEAVSECRVTKLEIGRHFTVGDLIANLVYDRNTKFRFVVYGKFDLGQTGVPRAGDAQKIKALVNEWGGAIQKDINVDTDFVVMGTTPVIKDFSDEDLQDPVNRRLLEEQKADYQAYEDELDKAKSLNIPIMNQNRFLYFCGYYDNAQR